MNRFSKKPLNKKYGEQLEHDFRIAHIARHTKSFEAKPDEWQEFRKALYTELWKNGDGYVDPADLHHDIYKSSGIDGNAVAWARNYSCFEQMLHSDALSDVIVFQKKKRNPNPAPEDEGTTEAEFTITTYHAAVNSKFHDVKWMYKRHFSDIHPAVVQKESEEAQPKLAQMFANVEITQDDLPGSSQQSGSSRQPSTIYDVQSGLSPQPPLTEEELAALLIESEPEEYDGHEDDEDREAEEEQ